MKKLLISLLLLLAVLAAKAQTIWPPADRATTTNMVSNSHYVSPAGLLDFYTYIMVPYVAANGGTGSVPAGVLTNNDTRAVSFASTIAGNGSGLTNIYSSSLVGSIPSGNFGAASVVSNAVVSINPGQIFPRDLTGWTFTTNYNATITNIVVGWLTNSANSFKIPVCQ